MLSVPNCIIFSGLFFLQSNLQQARSLMSIKLHISVKCTEVTFENLLQMLTYSAQATKLNTKYSVVSLNGNDAAYPPDKSTCPYCFKESIFNCVDISHRKTSL